jgi:hypothetical protein
MLRTDRRNDILSLWFAFCALAALSLIGPSRCVAASPEEVDKALTRATAFIYAQQNNGLWEAAPAPPTPAEVEEKASSPLGGQYGGQTALAVYALLAAGESPQSDKLAKAIQFLKTVDIKGTYALGLRTQMYPFLPPSKDVRDEALADVKRFESAVFTTGEAKGLYDYLLDSKRNYRFDHSVSQYGVLGVWACERAGVEVSSPFWQIMEDGWNRDQNADGSWSYGEGGAATASYNPKPRASRRLEDRASMTVAGVATLFITQDYLHASMGIKCSGNVVNPHIEAGLKWISDNFENVFTDKTALAPYYGLYGVERVGVASGRKYLGKVNWYQRGSDFLVSEQGARGNWGSLTETCFATLFLSRGRAPVIFNKLQYFDAAGKEGVWNQRPRDVANLTHWVAKQTERDLNWQIVNLSGPPDELLDAPVLYISGNKPLKFSPADEAKLRQYCEEGGLIYGNPDCGSSEFSDSFRKLGSRLFHMYEFHELPKSHVIFTGEQYPRTQWKPAPSVLGLSNGVRELMILAQMDGARAWQLQEAGRKMADFEFPANVLLYAIDKQNLVEKGATYFVRENPTAPVTRTIKLARLSYAGNWDPEPAGWRRMQAILHNQSHIKLDVSVVKLGENRLGNGSGNGPRVAVLTGTAATQFTAEARKEIKDFVDGGGTLIVDNAGGKGEFASSAENELVLIFGADTGAQLKEHLPAASPIYNLPGGAITEFSYRSYAKQTLGSLRAPMLSAITINGRQAVYFSRLDLSAGIVGQPTDGIIGYSPATATRIMTNLVIAGGLGQNASVAAK